MRLLKISFISLIILLMTLPINAAEVIDPAEPFDVLPISNSEIRAVSSTFWNAQSIQDKVKTRLPQSVKRKFTRSYSEGQGCDIKTVTKTEASADVCELSEDINKVGKFTYQFSVTCSFGNYQVSVCSREERKLLNQIKVDSPSTFVQEEEIPSLDDFGSDFGSDI